MLRALIFDSYYDKHRGVIAYIRVFEGTVKKDDMVCFLATHTKAEVQEVGFFTPKMKASSAISQGEVGYVVTGLKSLEQVKVGDTITTKDDSTLALPGYKIVNPMVFASIFPTDASDYPKLRDSIAKLTLNDASLTYVTENIPAIGFGFRCGFLGLLHMDIVQERLSREFDLDLVLTTPSVEYKLILNTGEKLEIHTPAELPDPTHIQTILEPWVRMEILTPTQYMGGVIDLLVSRRGTYDNMSYLTESQVQITGVVPLGEMIIDFYDDLKSLSKGFATLSYEPIGFKESDLVKLDILVNGKVVDPMAIMVFKGRAADRGKQVTEKLKELIPRQQFEVAIQAAIGARIIARETIKPFRKDVTAKLYGGDVSRRKKLLQKQAKGKKRMKMVGNVEIPQSAFLNVLKK
jgi:GTP-binding protein LepA